MFYRNQRWHLLCDGAWQVDTTSDMRPLPRTPRLPQDDLHRLLRLFLCTREARRHHL